jgi:putative ABC transport system substrate-binding protein
MYAMKKTAVPSVVVVVILLAIAVIAQAQQPKKVPRLGYLAAAARSANAARTEAFRHGLRELGYVEGTNIAIEWRYAEGKRDRLPALAADLVGLKVHVIVTGGPGSTSAAKDATSTIPIVMSQDSDPVGSGFVASLARPGGNITGLSTLSPELNGKRLQVLKEIITKLSHVAILGTGSGSMETVKELDLAAGALGVKLQYLLVLAPKDIDTGFRAATKRRADAVLVLANPVVNSQRAQVVELAAKSRLPVIYSRRDFVEDDGGLMYYGVNQIDLDRRAAIYVDKILKGAKPAELPVEQPTKFEFVINLKTAKQIGLTIPQKVLARADRVIR